MCELVSFLRFTETMTIDFSKDNAVTRESMIGFYTQKLSLVGLIRAEMDEGCFALLSLPLFPCRKTIAGAGSNESTGANDDTHCHQRTMCSKHSSHSH